MSARQIFLLVTFLLVLVFAIWPFLVSDLGWSVSPWMEENHWKIALGLWLVWFVSGPLKLLKRK